MTEESLYDWTLHEQLNIYTSTDIHVLLPRSRGFVLRCIVCLSVCLCGIDLSEFFMCVWPDQRKTKVIKVLEKSRSSSSHKYNPKFPKDTF